MKRWNRLPYAEIYVDITGEYDDLSAMDIIKYDRLSPGGPWTDEELTLLADDIRSNRETS